MRYFWALMAYVAAIVVAVASCGDGKGGQSTQFHNGVTGGASSGSGSGMNGGASGVGGSPVFTTSSNGSGSGPGGGGTTDGGSDGGATCPGAITCQGKGLNCGMTGDGCGGILDCGATCPGGQLCGGAGVANVCATPPCSPVTCAALGVTCGPEGDGCGNTVDCGTCTMPDTCGGVVPGHCGHTDAGACVPKTCAQLGLNCGVQGDGCGGMINCGTCPAGSTCGGGGTASVCGVPPCTPKTCTQLGAGCGPQGDGCGGMINCGTCTMGKTCGGGGVTNQCGSPGTTCTGLCTQQVTCTAPATTSVSGTVYAPNGTDPLPNVLVYVPNAPVLPFTPGVTCDNCMSSVVTGSPLVSATTAFDGTFKLTNMPAGANIPLVIQNGRWRRQVTISNVPSCVNTPLAATLTRFPRTKAEGDIPLMGFVTGSVDALECVLRKIGIADSEFSDPTGNGRVRFYLGNGSAGSQFDNATPFENQLWGTQAALNAYDIVFFACQGDQFNRTTAAQTALINYANAGGRVFTTHYSYVWLFNDAPFSTTANWNVNQNTNFSSDPQTGFINQTFPKGALLAQWLKFLYPASTLGQIQIQTLRDDFTGVVAPSLLWIYLNDPKYPPMKPMHYTFDTPVGTPPAQQCGRVLYDDFHVEDAVTGGTTFPNECVVSAMSPQEKLLEFSIFDLGASICTTPPPVCTPLTCAGQNVTCGPLGDGCGNLLQCGSCPSGETCGGGGVPGKCGAPPCTPLTCAGQNVDCGLTGDGCGNTIMCGSCPSGETCGGGGMSGVCGTMGCTPEPCPTTTHCGPTGDGCGNIIQCGSCPSGETCGGGGTPGQCGAPSCTPMTCAQLGFNCGPVNDGCGNIIQCGTCSTGSICGGGTNPKANVCGTAVTG